MTIKPKEINYITTQDKTVFEYVDSTNQTQYLHIKGKYTGSRAVYYVDLFIQSILELQKIYNDK